MKYSWYFTTKQGSSRVSVAITFIVTNWPSEYYKKMKLITVRIIIIIYGHVIKQTEENEDF